MSKEANVRLTDVVELLRVELDVTRMENARLKDKYEPVMLSPTQLNSPTMGQTVGHDATAAISSTSSTSPSSPAAGISSTSTNDAMAAAAAAVAGEQAGDGLLHGVAADLDAVMNGIYVDATNVHLAPVDDEEERKLEELLEPL